MNTTHRQNECHGQVLRIGPNAESGILGKRAKTEGESAGRSWPFSGMFGSSAEEERTRARVAEAIEAQRLLHECRMESLRLQLQLEELKRELVRRDDAWADKHAAVLDACLECAPDDDEPGQPYDRSERDKRNRRVNRMKKNLEEYLQREDRRGKLAEARLQKQLDELLATIPKPGSRGGNDDDGDDDDDEDMDDGETERVQRMIV